MSDSLFAGRSCADDWHYFRRDRGFCECRDLHLAPSPESELAAVVRVFERTCRTCGGVGVIRGFFLGTVKKCPACDGSGRQ